MRDFMFKLDRCVWLAFLNQDKIYEAYESFNSYMSSLSKHKRNPEVKEEIEFTQKLFYTTLFEKNKIYLEKEDYSNALLTSNIMFNIDKFHVDAIKNYIKALAKTNQKDLCVDMIEYLKTITNNEKSIFKFYAEVYAIFSNYKKSIEYYSDYLLSKQEYEITAEEYNLLGHYYSSEYNNCYDNEYAKKSIELFSKANKLSPENRVFLKNICIVESLQNDYSNALKHYDKLKKMGPLIYDDAFDYATLCIKTGDFKEYFKYAPARAKCTNATYFPNLKGEKWDCKSNIKNKTLLVHYEQGFGDTILISGLLKRLKKYAGKIIYVVQNELFCLLENNNENITIIPKSNFKENFLEYDYWIASMDVYEALDLNPDTAVVDTNFINISSEKINDYKSRFSSDKLKIGISLFGNKLGNSTRDISIDCISKLVDINNAEFYILNKDFEEDKIPNILKNRIHNLGKTFNNFEDTACVIENCDLVISADNCILNLAGLLGKKTYGLFNWCYEYRWYDLTGEDVGWYKSVKPYICDKMDDWEHLIEKVVLDINNSLIQ